MIVNQNPMGVFTVDQFTKIIKQYLEQEEATKAKLLLEHCTPWNLEDNPEIQKLVDHVERLMHFPYDDNVTLSVGLMENQNIFRWNWVADKVEPNSTVFSFGVGGGELETYLARNKNCSVEGNHPCPEQASHLTGVNNITLYNELPKRMFCDYFLMLEVLEHFNDEDMDFVMNYAIQSSDKILLSTPIGPLQNGTRTWDDFKAFEHIRVFTENSFKKLIDKYNLEIIDFATYLPERQMVAYCTPTRGKAGCLKIAGEN